MHTHRVVFSDMRTPSGMVTAQYTYRAFIARSLSLVLNSAWDSPPHDCPVQAPVAPRIRARIRSRTTSSREPGTGICTQGRLWNIVSDLHILCMYATTEEVPRKSFRNAPLGFPISNMHYWDNPKASRNAPLGKPQSLIIKFHKTND